MKYFVGIKIYNSFEIEADSEEEAEEQVREFNTFETLADADYNITYVDEIKEIDIPSEMCQDLLDLEDKKNNSYAPATKQAVQQSSQDE